MLSSFGSLVPFGDPLENQRAEKERKGKAKRRQAARVHGENHCSDFRRELELMHTEAKQGREGIA